MEAYGNELNMTSPFPTHMVKGQIIVRSHFTACLKPIWLHQCSYEAQRYTWKTPITVLYESWKTRISRCSGWLDVRRAVLPSLPFAAFTNPAIFLPACVHTHTPIYALRNTFIHLYTSMHVPIYTIFLHPKSPKMTAFVCEKMGLWTPDLKNTIGDGGSTAL